MTYNRDIHHRRSIRLRGYDYSSIGAYFVTICVHERQCLFGDIVDGEMWLNDFGNIIATEWMRLTELRPDIETGEYVVMPNHFHGIVHIIEQSTALIDKDNVGTIHTVGAIHELPLQKRQQRRNMILPKIVGRFKMITTKQINIIRDTPGVPLWQRNYYEHIIRDDADYTRIAEYLDDNPSSWIEDSLHPDNVSLVSHSGNAHRKGNS